jgi:hypothetical protein
MKKTIRCVSITVFDRSETNSILTGEKRREEKSDSVLIQIQFNTTRKEKKRQGHFSIRAALLEKLNEVGTAFR